MYRKQVSQMLKAYQRLGEYEDDKANACWNFGKLKFYAPYSWESQL